ncbi:hypothetical protein [Roseibacillus persicicus]|uniref:hypothetical protein n=1 Tax=Roseibacillus persicicus TaxID=454148 RepID=UPI002812454C|nr:hypothetical protein [Roseibacillus persicicus]
METARKIIQLRESTRQTVLAELGSMTGSLPLLEHLFSHPATTTNLTKEELDISFAQANKLLNRFEELGLLVETTGQKRNRRYRFEPYLALFRASDSDSEDSNPETTQV